MYLIPESVIPYLLDRNLLKAEEVVNGDVRIIDARRRNRNFTVERHKDADLFVKQVQFLVPETINGMFREASCYQLAEEHPVFAPLKPFTPRFFDYDPQRMVMVIERIGSAENVTEYHLRLQDYPESCGAMIGEAMAAFHIINPKSDDVPPMLFPQEVPWILRLAHQADQIMPNRSGGVAQLVTQLGQMPDIGHGLANIVAGWRPTGLMHGDLKWDNFLMVGDGDQTSLRVIDWELADVGDPSWDLAFVFCAYVQNAHFMSMSQGRSPQVGRLHELPAAWPAIQALWRAYIHKLGLSQSQAQELLSRAVYFMGGRMIVTAVELLQNQPAMTPEAQSMLQLSRSIFARPTEIAAAWLGLHQAEVFQPQAMQEVGL